MRDVAFGNRGLIFEIYIGPYLKQLNRAGMIPRPLLYAFFFLSGTIWTIIIAANIKMLPISSLKVSF